jgi:hypothetical protein
VSGEGRDNDFAGKKTPRRQVCVPLNLVDDRWILQIQLQTAGAFSYFLSSCPSYSSTVSASYFFSS